MARPEQTEKATPKREREARGRGQVSRSPDLGGAVVFIAIIVSLHVTFMPTVDAAARSFAVAITHAGSHEPQTFRSALMLFMRAGLSYTLVIGTAFIAATALAILANLLQFGA